MKSSSTPFCMVDITQHALKGQKLLAQGNTLGIMSVSNAPCKGKSFKIHLIKMENSLRYVKLLPVVLKLLPYTFALPFGQRFLILFGQCPLVQGVWNILAPSLLRWQSPCHRQDRYQSNVEALMSKTSGLFIYF